MSTCSTASLVDTFASFTVSTNGYKLHTTIDMKSYFCLCISAMSDSILRAKIPPWIAGCRVFTRPPSISGAPVTSDTSLTGKLASRSVLAEPPLATNLKPSELRVRANSMRPSFLETLRTAVHREATRGEKGDAGGRNASRTRKQKARQAKMCIKMSIKMCITRKTHE